MLNIFPVSAWRAARLEHIPMVGFRVFLKLIAPVLHSMAVLYSQTHPPSALETSVCYFQSFFS